MSLRSWFAFWGPVLLLQLTGVPPVGPSPPPLGGGAAAGTPGRSGSLPVHTGCPGNEPGPAGPGALLSRVGQLVTVYRVAGSPAVGRAELWGRSGGCWRRQGGPWPAFIGRNGFSAHHREGDGTTPAGTYLLGGTVYGNQPNPGYRGAFHRLSCGDWWDEDPLSPGYNAFQHVPCGRPPPFGGDSEALWTETSYYPYFVVVEYNVAPVVPYAGSAIFVHASTGVPTTGCVSIPVQDLRALLRWLRPTPPAAISLGLAAAAVR